MKKPIITLDLQGGHTKSSSVREEPRSSPVGLVSLLAVHSLNSPSCQTVQQDGDLSSDTEASHLSIFIVRSFLPLK